MMERNLPFFKAIYILQNLRFYVLTKIFNEINDWAQKKFTKHYSGLDFPSKKCKLPPSAAPRANPTQHIRPYVHISIWV